MQEDDAPIPRGNEANFLADTQDDDGFVLDSLVNPTDVPEAEDLPVVRIDMRPVPKAEPPKIQRMITRTYYLPQGVPMRIMFANPFRKETIIEIPLSGDFPVSYASTQEDVVNDLTSFTSSFPAYEFLRLNYNGELWALQSAKQVPVALTLLEIIEQ